MLLADLFNGEMFLLRSVLSFFRGCFFLKGGRLFVGRMFWDFCWGVFGMFLGFFGFFGVLGNLSRLFLGECVLKQLPILFGHNTLI